MKLLYCCIQLLLLAGVAALLVMMPMSDNLIGGNRLSLPVPVYDTPGDIDGNGSIDLNDVRCLQRLYLEPGSYDSALLNMADLNKDGVINTYDTGMLLKYLAEEDPALMPPETYFSSFAAKEE